MNLLTGFDQRDRSRWRIEKDKNGKIVPELEDEVVEKIADSGASILCRQCRHLVTTEADRISVQGSHQHTFANPHGFIFQIGCFQSAPGCGYTGPLIAEFSWFKGFSWKIAVCRLCSVQLGWLFVSSGMERFYGLVLNRLIADEQAPL